MITEAILNVIRSTVEFLLGLLPNIPQFPAGVLDGVGTITSSVGSVMGIIAYVFTPALLLFGLTSALVLLNFDNIFKAVLFFLHKIRG